MTRTIRTLSQLGWLLLGSFSLASAAQADVLLVGDTINRSAHFVQSLRDANLAVGSAGAGTLRHVDPTKTPLVVLASEKTLPADTRLGLSRFLESGGYVVVIGGHQLDYAPRPAKAVSLGRFTTTKDYRIVRPQRADATGVSRETARNEVIHGPDGSSALRFQTTQRGFDNFLVELDATDVRSPTRTVLQFWAKGDSYMDLLALEIRD